MKAMIVGDIHISDKPLSIRTPTYKQDILDKLDWISREAVDRGCKFILQLGDIFHLKHPSRNSHELVVDTHDALMAGGLPVVIIAGNHDIMHDRLESIPSQPIGALSKMEGIHLLEGWHPEYPVYGIPYLADWTTLPEWMEDWHSHFFERAKAPSGQFDSSVGVPLIATHAPLFPPGQEPIYDYVDPADWAALQKYGSVSYGHIHDPHGVYKVGDVQFANFGAISRGSLHAETLKRKPQVAIYDFRYGTYEAVEVPHKPAEEVFMLDVHHETVEKKQKLASFLEGLGSGKLEVTTVEKVIADLDAMELSDATRAAARELVEQAYGKF
jgi:DNA repair exonuclease SbcCD nuclease subunit